MHAHVSVSAVGYFPFILHKLYKTQTLNHIAMWAIYFTAFIKQSHATRTALLTEGGVDRTRAGS